MPTTWWSLALSKNVHGLSRHPISDFDLLFSSSWWPDSVGWCCRIICPLPLRWQRAELCWTARCVDRGVIRDLCHRAALDPPRSDLAARPCVALPYSASAVLSPSAKHKKTHTLSLWHTFCAYFHRPGLSHTHRHTHTHTWTSMHTHTHSKDPVYLRGTERRPSSSTPLFFHAMERNRVSLNVGQILSYVKKGFQ